MLRVVLALFVPGFVLSAASADVESVRAHVARQIEKQPNYTCLQETRRFVREPRSHSFERVDTVRLEVLVAGDRELFSWPGEANFADEEIGEIVRGGAIGSGVFGLFTRQLFLSNTVAFVPAGEGFSFRVPQFLSGFTIVRDAGRSASGYEGTFHVDPATNDLLRLELQATDLPPDSRYESVRHQVTYRDHLPATALSIVREFSGREFRNEIRFVNCHEFRADSSILPAAGVLLVSGGPSPVASSTDMRKLLPGLSVDLQLQSALDHRTAALGDTFSANLAHDLRLADGTVLRKGTALKGRIHRFERQAEGAYMVSLRFPLIARLETVTRKRKVVRDIGSGGAYSGMVPTMDVVPDPLSQWEKDNATFRFGESRLPARFRMTWITENPTANFGNTNIAVGPGTTN